MPITSVSQWDGTTPANNTDLNSITLLENQTLPSHVNGLFREMMKQIKAGVSANTLMAAYSPASASSASYLDFYEDTDNGTNRVRLIGPASTSDVTVTLPATTGTVALAADAVPYTAASSSGAASIQLAEDTDNGAHKLTLQGAASMAADATMTLPAGALDMTDWRTGQIKFPASQAASADANTFDDYEEGQTTPTPTARTGTLTSASATVTYVKTGRLVTFSATVVVTTAGTGSGYLDVAMPFAVSASGGQAGLSTRPPD